MTALEELNAHLTLLVFNAYGNHTCKHCPECEVEKLILHHSFHDGIIVRRHFGNNNVLYFAWLQFKGFPDDLGLEIMCYSCHSQVELAFRSGVPFVSPNAQRNILKKTELSARLP